MPIGHSFCFVSSGKTFSVVSVRSQMTITNGNGVAFVARLCMRLDEYSLREICCKLLAVS